MQIVILILLVAVLVLVILLMVKVSYNKTLIKSLAQTVAKVYDLSDKLDTSVEALMLWMKDNKAEYKGFSLRLLNLKPQLMLCLPRFWSPYPFLAQ